MGRCRARQEPNRAGTTILWSSHHREGYGRLCRNTAIVDKGRIVRNGPKEEFFTEPGGLERAYLAATGRSAEHAAVAAR